MHAHSLAPDPGVLYNGGMNGRLLLLPLVAACATSAGTVESSDAESAADVDTPIDGPDRSEDTGQPSDTGDAPEPEDADPVVLFINELMAANDGAVEHDGAFPDWFEVYNPGRIDISLAGFTVTDDLDEPTKAPLDDQLVVPAGGFVVLWATGDAGPDQVPFKLSSDGEALGLFFPDGSPADQIQFGAISDNLSLARDSDGDPDWAVTAAPTPGAPNDIE